MEEVKRRLWSDGHSFVVGAFEDSRLVGMTGFYRENGLKTRPKARIWGVYLRPEKRGMGVGKKLLEAAIDRGRGIDRVEQILL